MERSVEVFAIVLFVVVGLSHLLQPRAWVEFFILLRDKGEPVVFNEPHLRRVLGTYVAYYQRSRTHLALGKDAPVEHAVQPTGGIVVRLESRRAASPLRTASRLIALGLHRACDRG
jgi:hypothetical protein